MIIALFPNEQKTQALEVASEVSRFFEKEGVTVVLEDEKAKKIGAKELSSIDPKEIQFLISLGGDGTLLRTVDQYGHFGAPILGVNLGHLGFMADIPSSDIFPSLKDLLEGHYTIRERVVLEVKKKEENKPIYAVNDVVIHRASNYSLIELAIYVDEVYVNTFVADGIIIATPTGSTAYNLAAGGPIISPAVDALVMTPICPHTISNRPILIPQHGKIEIRYLSEYDPIDVRADGLNALSLESRKSISIEKSTKTFKLVNLKRHEYFSTLRTKLGWSGKIR